jgi:hypothetical protein
LFNFLLFLLNWIVVLYLFFALRFTIFLLLYFLLNFLLRFTIFLLFYFLFVFLFFIIFYFKLFILLNFLNLALVSLIIINRLLLLFCEPFFKFEPHLLYFNESLLYLWNSIDYFSDHKGDKGQNKMHKYEIAEVKAKFRTR